MFRFAWFLCCALSVDEKIIGFKGRHVYKMIVSYKKEGYVFQVDALYNQVYTYVFLEELRCARGIKTYGIFTFAFSCIFFISNISQ